MLRILERELEITEPCGEFAGYYKVTVYGGLSILKGHHYAVAHFGTFERKGRYLEYSATVWRDASGDIYHDYESEFCDDMIALRRGNVELLT